MKNALQKSSKIIVVFLISALIASCGGLKDHSSSKLIQKRKYTKGYQVNVKLPKIFQSKDNPSETASAATPTHVQEPHQSIGSEPNASAEIEMAVSADLSAETILPVEETKPFRTVPDQAIPGLYDLDETSLSATKQNREKRIKRNADGEVMRTTPAGAIVSFIFGLASLLVFALPFGLVAVITGIISLSKINANPTLYKGRGFAIVGIIIGIIAVLVGALAISAAA